MAGRSSLRGNKPPDLPARCPDTPSTSRTTVQSDTPAGSARSVITLGGGRQPAKTVASDSGVRVALRPIIEPTGAGPFLSLMPTTPPDSQTNRGTMTQRCCIRWR